MKLELIAALGRAAEGQTVGWIGNRWHEISDDFILARKACENTTRVTIHRINGREEITFPNGGRILFLTPHRVRSYSLDRAYVPAGATHDTLTAVIPALDTTSGPLVEY